MPIPRSKIVLALQATALCSLALLAVLVATSSFADSHNQPQPTRPSAAESTRLGIANSCASCHGDKTGTMWRQSYTVWASQDPHADAYNVLMRDVSKEMVRKLNHLKPGESLPDEEYQSYINQNCATCHATHIPETASLSPSVRQQIITKGVSCQSCHGAADTWLEGHLQADPPALSKAVVSPNDPTGWKQSQPDYGLRKLDDTITRARTCVSCHVGSVATATTPHREVNHDLIAAGHPRLAFEYTSHVANMPRHWEEKESQESKSATWAIGQLVAADAAIELLLARVDDEQSVWPEFSEYNCASCHHNLRGFDSRDAAASAAPRGAFYDWGSWYFATAPHAAANQAALRDKLEELSAVTSPIVPVKAKVQEKATNVRAELLQALTRVDASQADQIALQVDDAGAVGWDTAAQVYLWHAHQSPDNNQLSKLYELLEPAQQQNGPLWLHNQMQNEPGERESKVRDLLEQLGKSENEN